MTIVKQNYTSNGNVSVTVKDGVMTKVTLWTSGDTAKHTERYTAEAVVPKS